MPDEPQQPPADDSVNLRVRWSGAENVPVTFANAFLCQRTPHEFLIAFAQLVPPALESMAPEEVEKLTEIPARVVFQVGLSPQRMLELIDVLQRNYDAYAAWLDQTASEREG
jgi:hypothetical protein